ncbi:unnamed protein product [Rotaria sp. Silwood1]|nr:unnamed protein product [Rotaria sp. Silwood1]CAF1325872.1 unnamed protein product [Rotaria sp. Silwood1]CAF1327585.1 unnamed protein product [Rotaria sp. Silwood1]CAF3515184.1 unnamed protein product [Rotaria sp. Silwood1]CAF3541067.1 unnamed protein product [Rotaria sp. Silwood1]
MIVIIATVVVVFLNKSNIGDEDKQELSAYKTISETIQTFERNLAFFNEYITNFCVNAGERVAKGELEDELPDDTRKLLDDKDTIMNACQTSDEVHRTKIDQREDEMFSCISNWLTTTMDNIHEEEEYKRNRKRIIEISPLIDYLRADIEDM